MAQQERIECFEDIVGTHPGADHNSQGLTRELIEHRQHLVAAPIAELVVDEVLSRQIASQSPAGQWMAQTWFWCVGLIRMIELSLW